MKTRGLLMAVAVLLAGSATLAVFLYVSGVKKTAKTSGELVAVVVSEKDVPAGTSFDQLMAEGGLTTEYFPESSVVSGAVTNLSELDGRVTNAGILAGEQITTARLRGSRDLPGGTLGIPDGHAAVAFELDAPRVVGGAMAPGDRVMVFATFSNLGLKQTPKTVVVVPEVEVLKVQQASATRSNSTGTTVTLALEPRDAQKLVFAQEQGSVWLALLPPDEDGKDNSPVGLKHLTR
jgi:pilus assembly protein CpaB